MQRRPHSVTPTNIKRKRANTIKINLYPSSYLTSIWGRSRETTRSLKDGHAVATQNRKTNSNATTDPEDGNGGDYYYAKSNGIGMFAWVLIFGRKAARRSSFYMRILFAYVSDFN